MTTALPDFITTLHAYELMYTGYCMANIYEANRSICTYVHATARGHEAIQLAAAMQLQTHDWASPYYRDEAMLLGMGFTPYDLMLQLLAKADDPFSGGRTYYTHPSSSDARYPRIIHQSSATGMQVIPTTGIAQGIQYQEQQGLLPANAPRSVVLCSIGDGAVTEGEVSEAWQFAALKQLPIIYLVQDNDWGISVSSDEARCTNAYEYVAGFKGIKRLTIDGTDFALAYKTMHDALHYVRTKRRPILVHARVPLLNHHTSGVRKEWYRHDLAEHQTRDPLPKLREYLLLNGADEAMLLDIEQQAEHYVADCFEQAVAAPDPLPETVQLHEFAPTPVTDEAGNRSPANGTKVVMVDAALLAMDEILQTYPEAVFYGQDVGRRLGGVFREAATLAEKYGDQRVFNTAIQEAYLVGSTAGMSAVGLKPIVEIQFADYLWAGVNQLVCELSKSCYLTMGKYPIQALIRVPIGAYGGGGPYHSGCIESSVLAIKGIKVVYPSNAADMKGLLKAAFLDPNPVVFFEHKGIYWSKVAGTDSAKMVVPDADYVLPLGKAHTVLQAEQQHINAGKALAVITYGMGVHWATAAAQQLQGQVTVIDLRTLNPLDEAAMYHAATTHHRILILTEEGVNNSFAQTLAGRISEHCFSCLDAPVSVLGARSLPAMPLNANLERAVLPNPQTVLERIQWLLAY